MSFVKDFPWPGPEWPAFILRHLPVGVVTVDASLKINYMNPKAEELTGNQAELSLGRNCGVVLQGGLCNQDCPLHKVLNQERTSVNVETTMTRVDGTVFPVSLRIAAMYGQEGELVGAVELFADISRVKRLEAERAQTLSMFAHDMKSPLITVGGLVDRLLQGKAGELEPRQQEYLKVVDHQIKRVQALALDFLDTARLGKEGPDLVTVPLDLAGLLGGLARDYAARLEEAGQSLELSLPESLPRVQADSQRLPRVFANLVENAIQYAGHGVLRLEARATGDGQVVASLCDSGPGLSPEDQAKLFTPFFRGSAAQGKEGTGLGLAAVKAIMEAHGGGIEAENRAEGGACFRLTLPAAPKGQAG
ncbi:MAG: PAS domain-containing sensor histidine kinase [Desulfarculaceae bacterium]|nr:PAS domain-containing sensor histidine kinase [Desulfarculaceae bacterium]MCF8073883.1 PAS domain-containing sensor histidine kinase [Desulfarculaceae bacterium]MCF8102863.1 PAS domain-containing sensor histidine kinase [Desulfarculaceae bacterium]MCF8116307.1 PAS domain-containing sensor histidine kinase [Desulfarculaceae bacterium]